MDETLSTMGDHYLEKIISPQMEAFLRSVISLSINSQQDGKHKVALDKCSNMLLHELSLMSRAASDDTSFRGADFEPLEAAWNTLLPLHTTTSQGMESKGHKPIFVSLGGHIG